MARQRTVYIAGAGIAGLTLALALAKFGLSVVVLEKSERVEEFGAGLQISPNARKCLDRLGLGPALDAVAFQPEAIDVYPFAAATPLVRMQLGAAARARYGAPYAVMHRGDLAEILFRAAKRFANIDMLFGTRAFDLDSDGQSVQVTLEEAHGKTRKARPFAFIGADGVHSFTRTMILGGPEARYSGYVAWRALIALDALPNGLDLANTSLLLGPGCHLVAYPLPHRQAVNLALFTEEPANRLGQAGPSRPVLRAEGRSRHIGAVMAAVGDGWTPWVAATVSTEHWHRGAVGLIGDAAHAMVPFQAQGAAMGIEDATVLAPLLAAAPDAGTALARYASARQARVARVQKLSLANGRIFHMRRPLSLARDMVMRMQGPQGHFRRLDWLYGYDAGAAGTGGPKRPS